MSEPRNTTAAAVIAFAVGAGALAVPALVAAGIDAATHPAAAACDSGARIDKSTVADARKEMQKAGYTHVHDLKKGCDNYWHGVATHDGKDTHVVVTPDGKVMTEGD